MAKSHSTKDVNILTTYPFLPAKKANKLSKDEKRDEETFNNLQSIINSQFDIISEQINTNNSDW